MSNTKGQRKQPVRQTDRDVKGQDRQLYGKNEQTEMSTAWQSRMRWEDDGKTNRQRRQQQKQETSLLFFVAAVTMHLLHHLVHCFLCCLCRSSKMVISRTARIAPRKLL